MTDQAIVDFLSRAGAAGTMAFFILGWARGWFYSHKAVEKMEANYRERVKEWKQEAFDWRDIALKSSGLADRAVDLVDRRRARLLEGEDQP